MKPLVISPAEKGDANSVEWARAKTDAEAMAAVAEEVRLVAVAADTEEARAERERRTRERAEKRQQVLVCPELTEYIGSRSAPDLLFM